MRGTCAPFRLLPATARVSDAVASFRLAPLARFALRLPVALDARCVRPTSASPHSYYEHLRLVGSRFVMGLSPHSPAGSSVFHDTAARFGGSVDFFCAGGVLFPAANRRDRTSDLPVAPPSPPAALSHAPALVERAETEPPAIPVTRPRRFRSGTPSIDECAPPRSERRFRPRTSKRAFLGPSRFCHRGPSLGVSSHPSTCTRSALSSGHHAPFPRALGPVCTIGPSV